MKKNILILFILISFSSYSQQDNLEIVKWQTFEKVGEFFSKKKAPILIWLYEDDSDSCKLMQDSTLYLSEVSNYINTLVYPIKLNAKTNDTITFFNGEKFIHEKNKKYHNLIYTLLSDSISFPSLILFDETATGSVFYGYKSRDDIFPILIYYVEKSYKSITFDEFKEQYFKAYPPGVKQIVTHLNIHWLEFEEMKEKQKIEPRKVLIDIYYNYSITATIMRTQTYNNPKIANYLNKNYYCTTVNAKEIDTLELKGVTYINQGASHGYHDFAIAVLQAKMDFPAFIILDEDYNLLERKQLYFTPKQLEPIIKFYGDDKYKNIEYKDFLKDFESFFEK